MSGRSGAAPATLPSAPFCRWRGGRVVEGAALEMLYRGNSIEGSNPSLSVIEAGPQGRFFCGLSQVLLLALLRFCKVRRRWNRRPQEGSIRESSAGHLHCFGSRKDKRHGSCRDRNNPKRPAARLSWRFTRARRVASWKPLGNVFTVEVDTVPSTRSLPNGRPLEILRLDQGLAELQSAAAGKAGPPSSTSAFHRRSGTSTCHRPEPARSTT